MRISDWSSDVCSSDLPGIDFFPFDPGLQFTIRRVAPQEMTMRTAISFLALLAMSAAAATASAQTPATQASPIPATDLMTRWGKAVTPANAWRSYPRPQLKRARWQNPNGDRKSTS